MCLPASLLPTPRDPECRNSQTRSCSSRLTSMKWFPEPRLPSCSRQFGEIISALSAPARSSSSAIRCSVPASWTSALYLPADSGIAASIASRRTGQVAASPDVLRGELGAHRDHPAADVHPDRGRNDRTECRDDRADGRAAPEVRIRHERDPGVDEGHGWRCAPPAPGCRPPGSTPSSSASWPAAPPGSCLPAQACAGASTLTRRRRATHLHLRAARRCDPGRWRRPGART